MAEAKAIANPVAGQQMDRTGKPLQGHPTAAVGKNLQSAGKWSTGLCPCTEDPFDEFCCIGTFCPCVLHGQIAHRLDKLDTRSLDHRGFFGSCCKYWLMSMVCLSCCIHQHQRGTLRHAFHLPDQPCSDDIVTSPCCTMCANCQEARQLRSLGKWDLTKGVRA